MITFQFQVEGYFEVYGYLIWKFYLSQLHKSKLAMQII